MCTLYEMARTKGNQVVSSDTESDRESSLFPPHPPLKKWKGISINEPLEIICAQRTNAQAPTSGGKKVRKHITTKHVNIRSKLVSPPQDPNHASHFLLIITPRAFNRLKAEGEQTILEECRLSTDGVMSDYPAI